MESPVRVRPIFYRILQTAPGIFFELLGESAEVAQNYEFRAVEIKQLAFRLDGVFLPKPKAPDQAVVFVEVQFQDDPSSGSRSMAANLNCH